MTNRVLDYSFLRRVPPTKAQKVSTALNRLGWAIFAILLALLLATDYASAHRLRDWLTAFNAVGEVTAPLYAMGIFLPLIGTGLGNAWCAIPSILDLLLLVLWPSYGMA